MPVARVRQRSLHMPSRGTLPARQAPAGPPECPVRTNQPTGSQGPPAERPCLAPLAPGWPAAAGTAPAARSGVPRTARFPPGPPGIARRAPPQSPVVPPRRTATSPAAATGHPSHPIAADPGESCPARPGTRRSARNRDTRRRRRAQPPTRIRNRPAPATPVPPPSRPATSRQATAPARTWPHDPPQAPWPARTPLRPGRPERATGLPHRYPVPARRSAAALNDRVFPGHS